MVGMEAVGMEAVGMEAVGMEAEEMSGAAKGRGVLVVVGMERLSPHLLALDVRELVDVGRLLVNEPGWRLVEKRAEALHVDALVLGGEDVDHRLEAEADRAVADDLSHVRGVRGLEDGQVDA